MWRNVNVGGADYQRWAYALVSKGCEKLARGSAADVVREILKREDVSFVVCFLFFFFVERR